MDADAHAAITVAVLQAFGREEAEHWLRAAFHHDHVTGKDVRAAMFDLLAKVLPAPEEPARP